MTRGVARQVNKRFSLGNDTMASRMRALWLFLGLIMLLAATSVQSGCDMGTYEKRFQEQRQDLR